MLSKLIYLTYASYHIWEPIKLLILCHYKVLTSSKWINLVIMKHILNVDSLCFCVLLPTSQQYQLWTYT